MAHPTGFGHGYKLVDTMPVSIGLDDRRKPDVGPGFFSDKINVVLEGCLV